MGKFKYTKTEKEINTVLKYQDDELDGIHFPDNDGIDQSIMDSEQLLSSLGITLPDKAAVVIPEKRQTVIVVPSWESLHQEAKAVVGNQVELEELFSSEELNNNEEFIKQLNKEYNELHRLDKYDICIAASAGILSAAVDILMVGIPKRTPEGLKGKVLSDYVRDYFKKRFPEEEMERLSRLEVSKVPYDAQHKGNVIQHVEGLSPQYHRLLSLGHDPLLGFVVGVSDIMTGRMTTIDKSGNIVSQVIPKYAGRTEKDVFHAIAKQLVHLKTDVTTSMGLPAPLMGLFNLFQFGSIGELEQTIAEIVQGMYYEGYDFIHFCSLSIPVMIAEVIIRIGYALKRIKEGHSVKESIPISLNHEKHPKLATMLFVGHSAATAANAGRIYFTKNPMAINYPQWLAFSRCSYKQLKWVLYEKPAARDAYVKGILYEDLEEVFSSVNDTFEDFSKDYVFLFE